MSRYISLSFFSSYTRTTYSGVTTPTSTFVQELIEDSETEIDEVTGRTWGLEHHTDEVYDEPKQEILLKHTPLVMTTTTTDDTDGLIIEDGNGNILVNDIDGDYTIDGNIIVFNKNKSVPDRVLITYTSGYDTVRTDVKMLTTLLTIQKLVQSSTASADNVESISVGSISITSKLGATSIVNIDADVQRYWKRLRKLIR